MVSFGTTQSGIRGAAPDAGRRSAERDSRAVARRGLLHVAVPLILLFALSLPAVTQRIYASDEALYFAFLRSLWFDHDVSFDNEYQHFYEQGIAKTQHFHETFLENSTDTGQRINFGTIGCAILWSPFYAVADAGVRVARMAGSNVPADGYSRPYVAAVCYASAVYGFLALLLSLAAARRVVPGFADCPRWRQLAPVVVGWIGTPLVFYMYVAPPYAHACSAFVVAALVVTWLRVRDRWSPGGLAALGALAALMTMVREQDAVYAAGPALDFGWMLLRRLRQQTTATGNAGGPTLVQLLGSAAAGAATFAVVFVPQALVYLALNGRIGPSPLVTRKMNWMAPHALQVLLSPEHGFLVWTPLAAVALAGLVLLALRNPARIGSHAALGREVRVISAPDVKSVAVCLLVMAALGVFMAGGVESWTVAGAFGQRRFIGLTIALVIGFAALLAPLRGRRLAVVALWAVLVAGTWWNLGLVVQFGAGMMDRQRLEPARNAYNTFVVVPARMPGFAYRYLFDRASFYHPPASPK